MENRGPEHFFPGIPSVEKRYLESGTNWLLPEEIAASSEDTNCGWRFQDEENPVSPTEIMDFDFRKAKYPDDIEVQVVPQSIEKGKPFDIISLLSPNHNTSNYLVRSTNNNDRVDIETLAGKYIMLCCSSVPSYRWGSYIVFQQALSLASHELSDKDKYNFEMVLVVKMKDHWADDKAAFDHFVSAFSCLVVPFDQPSRRDYICKSLNFEAKDKGFLVAPDQIVVQDNIRFLTSVGVYAFPFTDDRLGLYKNETWKGKSLEELLGRTPSDYLEKNCPEPGVEQPEKASISELKKKVVGLYLCISGEYIPMLEKGYQEARDREHGFEIVLVYMPFYLGTLPEVFQEVINGVLEKRKIFWWVLPFCNSLCRNLYHLSGSCISDQLIIVSPSGELVEHCGGLVLEHFGIKGYPFTREGLVKAAFKIIERHSLESLLEGGSLYRGNVENDENDKVCVSDLQGRSILLYLGFSDTLSYRNLLAGVYHEIKAKNPDFEVVLICLDNFDYQNLPQMPWLVFHPNPSQSKIVAKELLFSGFLSEKLVAFDKDGQICSINAQDLLSSRGSGAFPFSGDLFREIVTELRAGCGSEFMFDMVWSDSFVMDERMTTSPYGASILSSSRKYYRTISQKGAKRVRHVNQLQ